MKNNENELNIEAALDDNVIFSKMQAQILLGQDFFSINGRKTFNTTSIVID